MRHHGTIEEDRRGLAVVAGLLFGIVAGASLLGWIAGDDAPGDAPGPEPALSRAAGLPGDPVMAEVRAPAR